MVSVHSVDNLAAVIGDPFLPFNWTISNKPLISLPHKDEVDKGAYLSAALVTVVLPLGQRGENECWLHTTLTIENS